MQRRFCLIGKLVIYGARSRLAFSVGACTGGWVELRANPTKANANKGPCIARHCAERNKHAGFALAAPLLRLPVQSSFPQCVGLQ